MSKLVKLLIHATSALFLDLYFFKVEIILISYSHSKLTFFLTNTVRSILFIVLIHGNMEQNFAPEKCLVAKMPAQEMLGPHLSVSMIMISQGLPNFREFLKFKNMCI